jgi:hypothetical protein
VKIKVLYGIEPVLEAKYDEDMRGNYGLHRDRTPDTGWGEYRWTRLDEKTHGLSEVELNSDLKKILIEDICERYKGDKAYMKLREFDLIKDQDYFFPEDLDSVLVEAERQGWVFHNGIWVQSGWRNRTTAELYETIKK